MTAQSSILNLPGISADTSHNPPPPINEVKQFWDSLKPVVSDVFAADMLAKRNIDPALVDRFDLARVIPADVELPSWARFRPRDGEIRAKTWYESGHRLIVPCSDHCGTIRSVKGRSVYLEPFIKDANPLDYGLRGLAILPCFERYRIDSVSPDIQYRSHVEHRRWVICEGIMDFLTWGIRIAADPDDLTLLMGIFSGSFNHAWAETILSPLNKESPPDFYIRVHHDGSGDKYARLIHDCIKQLKPSANIYRSKVSKRDDNALAQDFLLVNDPRLGCEIWTPPPIEEKPKREPKAERSRKLERDKDVKRARWYQACVDNAIHAGAAEVRASGADNHNNELYRVAAAVSRFQHTPYWNETLFLSEFRAAAASVGQLPHEIEATINSAVKSSKVSPQDYALPDPPTISKPERPKATQTAQADLDMTEDGELLDGDEVLDIPEPIPPSPFVTQGHTAHTVWLNGFDLDEQCARSELALASRTDIFSREGRLMRVNKNDDNIPHMEDVPQSTVRVALSTVARFFNLKGTPPKAKQVHPPLWLAQALVDRANYPNMRALKRITKHPVFLGDDIITAPGYHEGHALLYYPARQVEVPEIPERCTLEMARKAYEDLCEPFCDFQFDDNDVGLAATVSLVLAHLARPLISGRDGAEFVPLYLVDSTTPGVGKGTLLAAINTICVGFEGLSPVAAAADIESEDKRLVSWSLSGRSGMVVFDNIDSKGLGNASLDGVLTSGRIEARVLGANRMIDGRLDMIFAATGNNVPIKGDLVRRMVPIVLDAPAGDLSLREFVHEPLLPYIYENRGKLLAAGLTILRAYYQALPELEKSKKLPRAFPSFSRWSKWCRDPLVWLGAPDFVARSRERAQSSDPQLGAMTSLLKALNKTHNGAQLSTVSLEKIYKTACADEDNRLTEEIIASCDNLGFSDGGRWRKTLVSSTLARYQGRDLGGLRLKPLQQFAKWVIVSATAPPET